MPGLRLRPYSCLHVATPLFFAAALASCWRYDPLYCDEQSDCADNPGLSFCDLNGTFPASEGIGRTCIPDPGGTCVIDDDCDDPLLPACVSGVCRECNATRTCGSGAPVCDLAASTCGDCRNDDDCADFSDQKLCASDGACVGCRDDNDCAAGSACDDETRKCTGCMQDSDCDSGICNEGPKTCVPTANILYVTATGTGTDCTKAAPCGTIAQAHQRVAGLRTHILLGPGAYDGGELRNKGFRLSGDGATIITPLVLQGDIEVENTAFRARLSCEAPGQIRLDSIRISEAVLSDPSDGALNINGAAVELTNSTIERTRGASGIRVLTGTLDMSLSVVTTSELIGVNLFGTGVSKVHRSTIIANGTSGMAIAAERYSVTNSIIANNGYLGIYMGSSPNLGQIEHNTIVGNRTTGEDAGGIRCDGASTTYRNNIFANNGTNVAGQQVSGCSATYSLFWPTNAPMGTGNIKADPRFAEPATNNFHIAVESPARQAADPDRSRSAPAVTVVDDFDGQPRAASGRADIGADEHSP